MLVVFVAVWLFGSLLVVHDFRVRDFLVHALRAAGASRVQMGRGRCLRQLFAQEVWRLAQDRARGMSHAATEVFLVID